MKIKLNNGGLERAVTIIFHLIKGVTAHKRFSTAALANANSIRFDREN